MTQISWNIYLEAEMHITSEDGFEDWLSVELPVKIMASTDLDKIEHFLDQIPSEIDDPTELIEAMEDMATAQGETA